MGRHPQLPSLPIRPLSELPEDPTPEEAEDYYRVFADRAQDLASAGGRRIKEIESRIRHTTRSAEKTQMNPSQLFYFVPG